MDIFYQRLMVHAATIDELLSDEFEPLPGQKGDAELAALRLAAWCQSCASGNWSLFGQRLERDGLTFGQVLSRFATVRRKASASPPVWLEDAIWIETALQTPAKIEKQIVMLDEGEPCAFEHLFRSTVEKAEMLLWSGINRSAFDGLNNSARDSLRRSLLAELSNLAAPALYERFSKTRKVAASSVDAANSRRIASTAVYNQFVDEMKAGGFRSLFEEKPVLLRLIATVTRQWIDTTRQIMLRLDADRAIIREAILHSAGGSRVAKIEGELSDPHNGGHSVQIITFEDGSRVVYKPKDLRLDVVWQKLIERFNQAKPPVKLKAMRAISRDGYGWTEFIDHTGCGDRNDFKQFFRRAGAWLALFHLFATNDMHQENVIAFGNHPVPIDLETILQANVEEPKAQESEMLAYDAAIEIVANSVMAVGLLPAYGRSPDNTVFAIGGMTADWNKKTKLRWSNINSDEMRPTKSHESGMASPNLPHIDGQYVKFASHIDDFRAGFAEYARFLIGQSRGANQGGLFDGFAGLPVRKVIRPTRFYYMLHQRLINHRTMGDGVIWSAQIDFIARLADWEKNSDLFWPLQRAERLALAALNVPYFFTTTDGHQICDWNGISLHIDAPSGMKRGRNRVKNFNEEDLAWQITVIQQNLSSLSRSSRPPAARVKLTLPDVAVAPTKEMFVAESDKIADELASYAIRRGPTAAWIGLDWLGDSDVFQLVCLGPDLYNGICGIAVFLAAHTAVTGRKSSDELARGALSYIRKDLRSRNAARRTRSLGLGAATGLGSIIYALTTMSKSLHDKGLLAEAQAAAELITDDLIAADKQLDVMGGSAGAILCLLRLYRESNSSDALKRAAKCGEHLLRQPRVGPEGRNCWIGQGFGAHALNGMSHGAAGFAYALASLSAATKRDDFAKAALECIAFEDSSYDAERHNWPDLRGSGESHWPCQWCHGAPGIGLARIGTRKWGGLDAKLLVADICNALVGAEEGWPNQLDTLCCGTLGNIEFFRAAGDVLGRADLRQLASQRLATLLEVAKLNSDYRWNGGNRRFNLGLFRGLAGVGYTLLREVDNSLPNVLIWE